MRWPWSMNRKETKRWNTDKSNNPGNIGHHANPIANFFLQYFSAADSQAYRDLGCKPFLTLLKNCTSLSKSRGNKCLDRVRIRHASFLMIFHTCFTHNCLMACVLFFQGERKTVNFYSLVDLIMIPTNKKNKNRRITPRFMFSLLPCPCLKMYVWWCTCRAFYFLSLQRL